MKNLPEPDEDGMVAIAAATPISEIIEELQTWPRDATVGISLASVMDKTSPTFMRLYYLEDENQNRIYVGFHRCWKDNGHVAYDNEMDENGDRIDET